MATASIDGIITDTSRAMIPGAAVTLTNVDTNVRRRVNTNEAGNYVFVNILPGHYVLQVTKQGFITAKQPEVTLHVNQTATYDFTLKVGSAIQAVTVHALGTKLQTSSATLGTTITRSQVNDLPLNGRNFTELLDLTPGVSPVSVGQNSGAGPSQFSHAIGTFSYPSVNGQSNRSNFFLLDGLDDQGSFGGDYNFAPIVDQIQEFKVESHNDSAEAGGALGSIISVITKPGTNQFHGDAWEFLRNNAFDARNTFFPNVIPFKQNMFGGTVGGPLMLPGYNGHDRTWFFAAYEGFRNHTNSTSLLTTATPAELNGDFSTFSQPIYNPFSTAPDPLHPGEFIRQPFPNNQIPPSLFNPGMVTYAKALFPSAVQTGIPGINAINSTPIITRQDSASLRFDHQFNEKNTAWLRYSGYTEPVSSSGGIPGVLSRAFLHGYEAGVNYTHTFSGNAVADFEFGRNSGQANSVIDYTNASPTLWQQAGFSPNFAGGFAGGGPFNPGVSIPGYLSFATGNEVQNIQFSNSYQLRSDVSQIYGRHTLRYGMDFETNNGAGPRLSVSDSFSAFNTANPESFKGTGNALASYLLGVPSSAQRRNVDETVHGGWVDGFYFQDTWQTSSKLTVNIGMRYDVTLMPIYGSLAANNQYVGDLNLQNGTYIVARVPAACGNGVGAPCIPGGTLPAHVVATPFSNHAIYHNTYDNWQPRLGIAYRLKPNTVIRGSFGRFFDNWAAATQTAQNYEGTWPTIGQLLGQNLNNPVPGSPTPTATAQDPFHLGTAPPLPAATPFNQVQWFANPNMQDPYSDQWNFGVEHQFGNNTVLNANYVGSESIRTDVGGFNNVALTPGPGNPQSRAPYPYIRPTFYDNSIGRASYNAFQFTLNHHTTHGLTYLLSYTWSKTLDFGADGWYGAEGTAIQNPYDLNAAHSVAGYDLPNMFSASWVYDLPFGSGQKFRSASHAVNVLIAGWEVNGIATLTSGSPYSVFAPGDIANTGNVTEFVNVVGNPSLSHPTPAAWFNKSAFADPPPFTFGNLGRNALRRNWFKNFDLSLFRDIPITESKSLEIRAEFFNAFNNVVWGTPVNQIANPTFGEVLGVANTPRQIQLALKFYF
ncbi:MAG TPA: TonB-dependent receptor [Terriglobia bacterium]|nr:TonB-dependent receptor [Terriglobia bacterium]